MAPKPIVGYWDFRGLAQPIRLTLAYAGVDFEDKRYSKGADGKGADWFDKKFTFGFDFPNIPYYIEGDVKLTHTLAILRYLGRKHKLDGTTEVEKNRIAVLEQQVADLNTPFFQLLFGGHYETAKAEYVKNLPEQLKPLSHFLGSHQWVAGSHISYVDFWLYEYLVRIHKFAPDVLAQFSNLKQFISRVESQPKVAEYIKKQGPQPFIGPASPWQDKY